MVKMKSIYIVTAGSYSEYRIVAIFDTLNKAEDYMADPKSMYDRSDAQIEEWRLNSDKYIDMHNYLGTALGNGQVREMVWEKPEEANKSVQDLVRRKGPIRLCRKCKQVIE